MNRIITFLYLSSINITSNLKILRFSFISFVVSFTLLTINILYLQVLYSPILADLNLIHDNEIFIYEDLSLREFSSLQDEFDFEFSIYNTISDLTLVQVNSKPDYVPIDIIGCNQDLFYNGQIHESSYGITKEEFQMINGYVWTDVDDARGYNVAVIDEFTSLFYFNTLDVIGNTFTISTQDGFSETFIIIGVVSNDSNQEQVLNNSEELLENDHFTLQDIRLKIYIPYDSQQRMFHLGNTNFDYDYIHFKVNSNTAKFSKALVNFSVINQMNKSKMEENIINEFKERQTTFLLFIFGILVISSINLINVLNYSLKSRASEYAIKRALGLSKRNLSIQILFEVIIILFFSSMTGVLLGTLLITMLFSGSSVYPSEVLNNSIILYLPLISIIIGFFIGILPAMRSMRINISTSLRLK